MVKGISRQVIVLHAPEQEMFEQAIFILKENAKTVTDEALMQEAKKLLRSNGKARHLGTYGPVWACGGAMITGIAWLIATLF